jgi:hypothetical protein
VDTKRKAELLRNFLEKVGATGFDESGEKTEKIFGLDKSGGILDPVISAFASGTDPRIPLEGVTSRNGPLLRGVRDYLRASPGSAAEDRALDQISLSLGELFKANSSAPSSMKRYADSWRNVANQQTEEEKKKAAGKTQSLYSLDEADFEPGRLRVTFQYKSDEYWKYEIKNDAWPLHNSLIETDWQPIQTDDIDNVPILDAAAKVRALEKFKGPDTRRGYEMHIAGWWPMVADGDRPRVSWECDADSNFRPRTTYLWNDFISELQGRPGIGIKETPRRQLETRARIP